MALCSDASTFCFCLISGDCSADLNGRYGGAKLQLGIRSPMTGFGSIGDVAYYTPKAEGLIDAKFWLALNQKVVFKDHV